MSKFEAIFNVLKELSFTEVVKTLLVPVIIGVGVFFAIRLLLNILTDIINMKKFTISNSKKWYEKLTQRLLKNKYSEALLKYIAIRINLISPYEQGKNLIYAMFVVSFIAILYISILILTLINSWIWYITFFYLVMVTLFLIFLINIFFSYAKTRFLSKLPKTLRILTSRYNNTNDIKKAIDISIDDFDRSVRKVFRKIQNALKKNNSEDIKKVFNSLEDSYDNPFFTRILVLIEQARWKMEGDHIKEHFIKTKDEIVSEMENAKDIKATTTSYKFLALLMFFAPQSIEIFNTQVLIDFSTNFYDTPTAIEIKIFYYIIVITFILILSYMEKVVY